MTNIDQPLYERIKEWIKSTYNIKSETISPNKETCFFIPKLNPKEAFNWGVMSQKIIDVFHVEPTIATSALIKFIEEEVR